MKRTEQISPEDTYNRVINFVAPIANNIYGDDLVWSIKDRNWVLRR